MGLTKKADASFYRQLVFYKILLDGFPEADFKMVSGEIDFVEPDDNEKFRKEKFVIEESAVEELKDVIRKVTDEIIELKFWDAGCDDKECDYCALREMIKNRPE
jgi:DNA helicase II / ATP-dependent DNA helicase PcrA